MNYPIVISAILLLLLSSDLCFCRKRDKVEKEKAKNETREARQSRDFLPPGLAKQNRDSLPPGHARRQKLVSSSSYGTEESDIDFPDRRPKPSSSRSTTRTPSRSSTREWQEEPVEEAQEEVPQISVSQWRKIERLKYQWENLPHVKSAAAVRFLFWLDPEAKYSKFDSCYTPDNELGNCHFVQHCPMKNVIGEFDVFLDYTCFIRNRYIGICCPESYFKPKSKPGSSSRPVTKPPTRATTERERDQIRTTIRTNRPVRVTTPEMDSVVLDYDPADYNGECGVSENPKIVGGAIARPNEWLWMAAILLKTEKNSFCGGALVSSNYVLTAAHCLRGLIPDDITIRLGEYDFSDSADPTSQDFGIELFRIHPKYNRYTNENDIALIKLKRSAHFTDYIKPICLPQKNRDYAEQLGIITGWGKTKWNGVASNQLRQVSLPIWNNTECNKQYSQKITKTFLCAGNRSGGKDSCQGDSGGPLMLQGPNNRWMIVGIVSWGVKCGEPEFPGVYTRVSEFNEWVKSNMRD